MEPFKLPQDIIEKFIKSFIPEAMELVSFMRPLKAGDGFSFKLRQVLSNLKISNWAPLYQDPQNIVKIKLLMMMPPEEINALNDELKVLSIKDQTEWVVEFINGFMEHDWEEAAEDEVEKKFEEMDDEEKAAYVSQLQRFFSFLMPNLFNYFSIMVHRKNIFQLVAEAMNGDDGSFLKAIQIDKTTLQTIPYFIERNRRAADEGDFKFQRQINTYRNKPIFVSRPRYPTLWLLLSVLEETNHLADYEADKDAFLDLCEELGVYGSKYGVEDVQSFSKRLREYKLDQSILPLEASNSSDVKDATSSK